MSRSQDTIYALSSGSLPAGVAVLRISGEQVPHIATMLCGGLPQPRRAALKWITDRKGEPIDQGLVLSFPRPNSFTGEDCLELQVHGGRASVAAIMSTLSGFENTRVAEAGEFARRAFDNGKLDLVEAEGLADLIAAETEMQRRLALEQSNGQLSALFHDWMARLTRCRALIEAELDFPEEEDVPGSVSDSVWKEVEQISQEISAHLDKLHSAEIIRDGFKVVIAGRPNAGKSSLLNALAKRDVAIVTEIAGTTRDLISVDLDIAGYLVRFTDTAGLRRSDDLVEQEGVRRAMRSAAEADLVLVLKDVADSLPFPGIDSAARQLKILTKIDKAPAELHLQDADLALSAKADLGIDSLTKRISEIVDAAVQYSGEATAVRVRQTDLLREVSVLLADPSFGCSTALEFKAEILRQASHLLGKITGFVDVEDLLDVIFSEFCIGK